MILVHGIFLFKRNTRMWRCLSECNVITSTYPEDKNEAWGDVGIGYYLASKILGALVGMSGTAGLVWVDWCAMMPNSNLHACMRGQPCRAQPPPAAPLCG